MRVGLTQKELADQAAVSLRSVQIWEAGKTNLPRPSALRSVAAVLSAPIPWLIGETDDLPDPEPPAMQENSPIYSTQNLADSIGDLAARLRTLPPETRARVIRAFHLSLDLHLQNPEGMILGPLPEQPNPNLLSDAQRESVEEKVRSSIAKVAAMTAGAQESGPRQTAGGNTADKRAPHGAAPPRSHSQNAPPNQAPVSPRSARVA